MPLEILAYETTPLGILCLRRRELLSNPGTMVTEVTLDHEFLMSSYLTESERSLSSMGLRRIAPLATDDAGGDIRVLVGGLGLGYTAAEALKSQRVAAVEVVEYLPEVISWLEKDLVPLASELRADQRFSVSQGDIYAKLTNAPETLFDLIAIDVDHSPRDVLGEQSHGFYSEDGLRRTCDHLKPDGVIGIWSYAEDTPLLENMRNVFCDVEVEQITVWNDLINVEMTDWLFFGRKP